MARQLLQSLTCAVCLGTGIWASFLPAAAAGATMAEKEISKIFEGLQSGTLDPSEAHADCLDSIERHEDPESLRQVFSTYLEVTQAEALSVLCEAVVQTVGDGNLMMEDLLPLFSKQDKPAEVLAAGRFLRAVYFAHNGIPAPFVSGGSQQ